MRACSHEISNSKTTNLEPSSKHGNLHPWTINNVDLLFVSFQTIEKTVKHNAQNKRSDELVPSLDFF